MNGRAILRLLNRKMPEFGSSYVKVRFPSEFHPAGPVPRYTDPAGFGPFDKLNHGTWQKDEGLPTYELIDICRERSNQRPENPADIFDLRLEEDGFARYSWWQLTHRRGYDPKGFKFADEKVYWPDWAYDYVKFSVYDENFWQNDDRFLDLLGVTHGVCGSMNHWYEGDDVVAEYRVRLHRHTGERGPYWHWNRRAVNEPTNFSTALARALREARRRGIPYRVY